MGVGEKEKRRGGEEGRPASPFLLFPFSPLLHQDGWATF
jgi:hypothetical protein